MPTARKHQVDLTVTPYYHCISRCVRRAYLCGHDRVSNRDFDHRKQWLVDQLHQLTKVFAIRICAYAIMSNHYHLVLFVDSSLAMSWSDEEVVSRWASLFPMSKAKIWTDLNIINFENMTKEQQEEIIKWRDQLHDISWFMRKLNEFIARQANKEDDCTGRFWEGRFKSQALLDESALLTCMTYVDLNPIRAGICKTPETSDFTSIQQRLKAYQKHQPTDSLCDFEVDEVDGDQGNDLVPGVIPCTQKEYFKLVDATGRLVKSEKAGAIPEHLAPILSRMKIDPNTWLDTVKSLGRAFYGFIGRSENIEAHMMSLDKKRIHGLKSARRAFRSAA